MARLYKIYHYVPLCLVCSDTCPAVLPVSYVALPGHRQGTSGQGIVGLLWCPWSVYTWWQDWLWRSRAGHCNVDLPVTGNKIQWNEIGMRSFPHVRFKMRKPKIFLTTLFPLSQLWSYAAMQCIYQWSHFIIGHVRFTLPIKNKYRNSLSSKWVLSI